MKKIFLLLFAVGFALFAQAQTPVVTATLDTNHILIGEQTVLHLRAQNLKSTANIVWPAWPDTLKGVELISTSRDTSEENGIFSIEEHFVLTSFDSGFVVIPPFVFLVDGENLETEPAILNVGTVEIAADKDFYDIKPPVEPPFDFMYWLKKLWFVALILAIIIAVILWFYLRKRKAKAAAIAAPDLRTPAQRAKDTLAAIREARIWQEGKTKLYYSQVSDTVRTYLEEEFNVPAMEMVSDELLDAMQTKISANANVVLRKMLRQADAVKFAKANPGPEQHTILWDDALMIINLTEPKTPDHAAR
jgi:hypothetical protein